MYLKNKMIYDDMRDAMFEELYINALKDKDVVLLLGDQGALSFKKFKENIPEQIINCGPSEQNLISIAAGLATCGKKVFIHGITPFVTLRCYEQISLDLGLVELPATIIGIGAGYSYSHEGPTHHSIQDVGIMKTIPGMTIYNAADTVSLAAFSRMTYNNPHLSYIKFDHKPLPLIYDKRRAHDFNDGMCRVKTTGQDTIIIATGNMVHKALKISEPLNLSVIDLYRIKPLNKELLKTLIKGFKNVIVLEEHLDESGIGSTIADFLADENIVMRFKRFGVQDYIHDYGDREFVSKQIGLDVETLTEKIEEFIDGVK